MLAAGESITVELQLQDSFGNVVDACPLDCKVNFASIITPITGSVCYTVYYVWAWSFSSQPEQDRIQFFMFLCKDLSSESSESTKQSWALPVFFHFFNNKK